MAVLDRVAPPAVDSLHAAGRITSVCRRLWYGRRMDQSPTRSVRLELAHVEIIKVDAERWSLTATYANETNTLSAETLVADYQAAAKVATVTPASIEVQLAP